VDGGGDFVFQIQEGPEHEGLDLAEVERAAAAKLAEENAEKDAILKKAADGSLCLYHNEANSFFCASCQVDQKRSVVARFVYCLRSEQHLHL
jgi:hypothetical protein